MSSSTLKRKHDLIHEDQTPTIHNKKRLCETILKSTLVKCLAIRGILTKFNI